MTEKDIYSNGVALLEEWEDVNYCEHSFKFKDEWLTDKEVVDLLNDLSEENELLKIRFNEEREKALKFCRNIDTLTIENEQLKKENQSLKEEKELLKNKLDRIEDILPHFLSCAEISEFRGKTVKEDLALMKCWNKRYQK